MASVRRRLPGWRTLLQNELHRVSVMPMEWGQHDCALFAAGCVKAMTGDDTLLTQFQGKYSTAMGAYKVILAAGYTSLLDLMEKNFDPIKWSLAQSGDIAAMTTENRADDNTGIGIALGIFTGSRIAVVTPTGYGTIPMDKAQYAFRLERS